MRELLAEYRSVIAKHHPALSDVLRPGLPRNEVIQKLGRLPFAITDDAVELYCWADGVEGCWINLIPIAYFMPLDEAISRFEHLLPHQAEFEKIFPQQYRQSFPFLSDRSDGGYGFGALEQPCYGRIISYEIHAEWTIGFNSLSDMVNAAIQGYELGLLDDEGEWDIFGFSKLVRNLYPDLYPKPDSW